MEWRVQVFLRLMRVMALPVSRIRVASFCCCFGSLRLAHRFLPSTFSTDELFKKWSPGPTYLSNR
jgi:hypothetical protein